MRPLSRSILPVVLVAISLLAFNAEGFAHPRPHSQKDINRLRERAEKGFVLEQVELADAYLNGNGVTQDVAQAAHWYLKAAESGDAGAENQIGYFYMEGVGVSADSERAFHWFQLSSASGLAIAKVNLGVAYLRGFGVRPDPLMARQLFREAVEKGVGEGAAYLAVMDQSGLGHSVDRVSAERWLEMGVRLHSPKAAFDLAYLYSCTEGHPHNLQRAASLLRAAAGEGYLPAKNNLGLLLANHPELASSGEESRHLLFEASSEGNWKSSVLMGILARDGNGVAADPNKAWYYFHLAGLQGGSDCEKLTRADLKALELKLSVTEQAAATARAEAWFRQHQRPAALPFNPADTGHNSALMAVAGKE